MVSLPEINQWTPAQLLSARKVSPAVDRYLDLLSTKATDFSSQLRLARHEHWLRAALASIHQTHSAKDVCLFWSQAALKLLSLAWNHHGLGQDTICLLAMGKLGAQELNLSSDIDIFFVSEEDVNKTQLKKVRAFISDLSEVRSLGFCFRVDLDLRPGGSTSPLVISFDQMTNHYGYQGETWERVAMIRQTIPLGPAALVEKVSTFCQKFSFRKHIDYSLFHDLYSMREKIQNHKFNASPWNIKFRKGGIRDLELLVHSLQLIHGGKNKKLVTPSLSSAIEELGRSQHLRDEDARALNENYWFFRQIENKIQCENDQHTYDLAASHLVSENEKSLFSQKADRIALIVDQLLRPYQKNHPQTPNLEQAFLDLDLNDESVEALWQQLRNTKIQSRSRLRDEEERQIFLKNVLAALKNCRVDPAMALLHLQQFLIAIKAKTSFFTLFNQHQELIEELVWIFSCSPFLSQILIHRPELIDSFLLKKVSLDMQDEDQFASSAQDFKFLSDLISSSQFLRQRNVSQLVQNLTQTTDTLVLKLLELLKQKFAVDVSILTLGKWAAQEMGLTSDLDFIFLTESEPEAAHFKLARRFIHFLNSPHSGQTVYPIDLRLRPSGSAGPLFLTKKDLTDYLNQKADVWERQAYLCFRELPEKKQEPLFSPRPLSPQDLQKLFEIQSQLLTEPSETLDLKKNRGGLLHTELTLQIAALEKQIFPSSPNVSGFCHALSSFFPRELCVDLEKNYFELRTYQQLLILISQSGESRFHKESAEIQKVAALQETSPKVLLEKLEDLLAKQKSLLNKLDPLAVTLKMEE